MFNKNILLCIVYEICDVEKKNFFYLFVFIITVFRDFAGWRLLDDFLAGGRGNRGRVGEILVEIGRALRQVYPTGHQVQVALVARYEQTPVHAGRFSRVAGQTFPRPGGHVVPGIFAAAPLGPVGPHAQLAAYYFLYNTIRDYFGDSKFRFFFSSGKTHFGIRSTARRCCSFPAKCARAVCAGS